MGDSSTSTMAEKCIVNGWSGDKEGSQGVQPPTPDTPTTPIAKEMPTVDIIILQEKTELETVDGEEWLEDCTWLRRLVPFYPLLVLENSGCVARDHLALERTFMSYTRTSLTFAFAGVTLVQLLSLPHQNIDPSTQARLHKFGGPIGAAAIGIGLVIMLFGFLRYFNVQKALVGGKFRPAAFSMYFLTLTFALGMIATFVVLLVSM